MPGLPGNSGPRFRKKAKRSQRVRAPGSTGDAMLRGALESGRRFDDLDVDRLRFSHLKNAGMDGRGGHVGVEGVDVGPITAAAFPTGQLEGQARAKLLRIVQEVGNCAGGGLGW